MIIYLKNIFLDISLLKKFFLTSIQILLNIIAKILTDVRVRSAPSVSSEQVESYHSGETVRYVKTENNEWRLWITYVAKSGNRRYCCSFDTNGEKYIELGADDENDDNCIGNNIGNGPQKVLASYFDDKIGCRDNDLYDGGLYYAELSKDPNKKDFSALGGLPFGQKLRITYKGKSVIASKGDVGAGGPNHPKIDIHANLAKELGFPNSLDYVQIEFV